MTLTGTRYSIRELSRLTEATERQIREWIAGGLLPSPLTVGRYARYSEEHLVRARIIVALRGQHRPLHEIRSLVNGKTLEELQSILATLQPEVGTPASARALPSAEAAAPSQPAAQRAQQPAPFWEVHNVRRGLVIMVCVEEGWEVRRLAEQMCETYREIAARLGSS